jgi:hypothetical protein
MGSQAEAKHLQTASRAQGLLVAFCGGKTIDRPSRVWGS